MNRRDFTRAVHGILRDNNVGKPVVTPKQSLTVTDEYGVQRTFHSREVRKTVQYTIEDIEKILDACIFTIEDSLKRGEPIKFAGFGALGLKYRAPRQTKMVGTNNNIFIEGHYIPKFAFGKDLRACAKIYELSLNDKMADVLRPEYDDDDEFLDEEE